MSEYAKRIIRLAIYNNMDIEESTDGNTHQPTHFTVIMYVLKCFLLCKQTFLKVLVVCAKLMPRIQQAKSQLKTTLQQLGFF
jgi:hypothetical protein